MNQVQNVLRIPAEVSQLVAVRKFIRDYAGRAGADKQATDDMVQAVDESVTNAIIHGYRGAKGTIDVEVDVVRGSLVVRLRDQAPPFDPTTVPHPDITLPLERRPLGGMGVHLTRQLTDEMTYRKTEGGNELTLVKQGISSQEVERAEDRCNSGDRPRSGGSHEPGGRARRGELP